MSSPSFFTQAENFSMIEGGVDPRTGMYNLSLNLGTVCGNNGLGPAFTFALSYSPLSSLNGPTEAAFGLGVALGMTLYDTTYSPYRLSLSSGEQYVVEEDGDTIIFHQKKLDTVHIEKFSDHYKVTYKSGAVEILTGPDDISHIKVPKQLINPLGHTLTLNWDPLYTPPRLDSIQDENQSTLLSIDYSDSSNPTVQFLPNQQEGYQVVINLQSVQLNTVTSYALGQNKPLIWSFTYSPVGDGSWGQWITSMTTPGKLTETASYYGDGRGAQFPSSANLAVLPQVYSFTRDPGGGSPAMTTLYSYTDHDFLGAGSGIDWDSTRDNLYFLSADYTYGSTETRSTGTTTITTTRTYNNYHLLTDVSVVPTSGYTYTMHTDYWADPTADFDGQPPQFQLPKAVTSTWTTTQPSASRTQVLQTVYDENGNLTQRTAPDNTVTVYEYYPADGSVNGCPTDPTGFVRFVKSVTTTPPATQYTDVEAQVVTYKYTAY